ncbi:MAG: hypothetical protein LBU43_09420 [Candidatus Accumulibacter sp.]|jgi:hypothetical protein|nr:hypothetical protein [Accumulibacter sp.]
MGYSDSPDFPFMPKLPNILRRHPAQTGIHKDRLKTWIPAFAEMTVIFGKRDKPRFSR